MWFQCFDLLWDLSHSFEYFWDRLIQFICHSSSSDSLYILNLVVLSYLFSSWGRNMLRVLLSILDCIKLATSATVGCVFGALNDWLLFETSASSNKSIIFDDFWNTRASDHSQVFRFGLNRPLSCLTGRVYIVRSWVLVSLSICVWSMRSSWFLASDTSWSWFSWDSSLVAIVSLNNLVLWLLVIKSELGVFWILRG